MVVVLHIVRTKLTTADVAERQTSERPDILLRQYLDSH
jgi:hypothetical protein